MRMSSIRKMTEGRVSRATFWKYYGSFLAFMFLWSYISDIITIPEWCDLIIGLIIVILIFLVLLGIQVRRWHDRNKSSWWVLINFIPIIGFLWMYIELGFIRGTSGSNKYGEDPLIQTTDN